MSIKKIESSGSEPGWFGRGPRAGKGPPALGMGVEVKSGAQGLWPGGWQGPCRDWEGREKREREREGI